MAQAGGHSTLCAATGRKRLREKRQLQVLAASRLAPHSSPLLATHLRSRARRTCHLVQSPPEHDLTSNEPTAIRRHHVRPCRPRSSSVGGLASLHSHPGDTEGPQDAVPARLISPAARPSPPIVALLAAPSLVPFARPASHDNPRTSRRPLRFHPRQSTRCSWLGRRHERRQRRRVRLPPGRPRPSSWDGSAPVFGRVGLGRRVERAAEACVAFSVGPGHPRQPAPQEEERVARHVER